jgi:hypothetical protein
MAKTLLSMQDLRWRALAEIRNQPGCSDVQSIAINRVSDPHAESNSNWSLCADAVDVGGGKPIQGGLINPEGDQSAFGEETAEVWDRMEP